MPVVPPRVASSVIHSLLHDSPVTFGSHDKAVKVQLEPVADSIRGTLDGHIVLDRATADQGRYPAVNILTSVSRLANAIWSPEQRSLIMKLKAMIAQFEDTRDPSPAARDIGTATAFGDYPAGLETPRDDLKQQAAASGSVIAKAR